MNKQPKFEGLLSAIVGFFRAVLVPGKTEDTGPGSYYSDPTNRKIRKLEERIKELEKQSPDKEE